MQPSDRPMFDLDALADRVAAHLQPPPGARLAWKPAELAERLGISDDAVLALRKRGDLAHFRDGRKVLIRDEAARDRVRRATAAEMDRFAAPVRLPAGRGVS